MNSNISSDNQHQSSEVETPKENTSGEKNYNRQDPLVNNGFGRLSFQMEEDEAASVSIRNNHEKIAISKINEKLEAFEAKLKSL